MAYLFKATFGAGLFLGGVALFNVKLIALLETGTCASGNTAFEISRPCPEGTETDALLLVAAVFAGLIGLGIFAVRGTPPWSQRRGGAIATGLWAWAIFFTATGAVSLYYSLTSESVPSDGKLGGTIVGATFLFMGLPALVFALLMAIDKRRSGKGSEEGAPAASVASPPTHAGSIAGTPGGWISSIRPASAADQSAASEPGPGGSGGDDSLARLERLQRLHQSGALTDGEFQLQKARILNE